jgi:VanZ family protein
VSPRARLLLRAWGPAAAWCLLIFTASSFSLRTGADLPRGSDKAAHLLEYGILGFLAARALLLSRPRGSLPGAILLGTVLAVLFGASDEIHQIFVPGRTAEWADLVADLLGALAGAGLLGFLRRRPRGGATATSPGSS